MLLRERNIQPIVCRGGLQLEIECTAEALSQRQAPGFVDPSAERGMNDELHTPALIKEAFGDHGFLSGDRAQHGAPGHDILDRLLGARIVKAAFALEPTHRRSGVRRLFECVAQNSSRHNRTDSFEQVGETCGKLRRASRCLAAPERHIGRRSLGVFDQHPAGFHAPNAPGGVSEQDDVARETLHREVFVHGANQHAFGLGKNRIERIVGDRAAAGDSRQPATPARADTPIHAVSVQVGGVTSAAAGDALGEHFHDGVEIVTREISIGIRPADDSEQFVLAPIFGSAHGHNLLGQDVQRCFGYLDAIQLTLADPSHQGGAFEQFMASRCEDAALRDGAAPVTRASNALQGNREGARRADLADQVYRANVDTQFKRSRGNKSAHFSGFQFLFGS